jgi:hypothetical protein
MGLILKNALGIQDRRRNTHRKSSLTAKLASESLGNSVWELRWEDESADSMDSISTSRLCKSQAAVGGAVNEISSRFIAFNYGYS